MGDSYEKRQRERRKQERRRDKAIRKQERQQDESGDEGFSSISDIQPLGVPEELEDEGGPPDEEK